MTFDPTDANDDKLNELMNLHRREVIKHLRAAVRMGTGAELDAISTKMVLATLMVVDQCPDVLERELRRLEQRKEDER